MRVTYRARIDRLRFKDGVITAGLNPYVLLGMVPILRNTAGDHPPILTGPGCPTCGVQPVLDGRHRWAASVMAGRVDVLADEER